MKRKRWITITFGQGGVYLAMGQEDMDLEINYMDNYIFRKLSVRPSAVSCRVPPFPGWVMIERGRVVIERGDG